MFDFLKSKGGVIDYEGREYQKARYDELKEYNVHVTGDVDIFIERAGVNYAMPRGIKIGSPKGKKNTVILGSQSKLVGSINFNGQDNFVFFQGNSPYPIGSLIDIRFNSNANTLAVKEKFTSNGLLCVLNGATSITIGRDVMIAQNVSIYSTDMHAIISLDSGEVINSSSDVTIGDHVWLGKDVMITKGLNIGSGAIIGAKSLVTKDIPNNTMAAGVPTKNIRDNVTWTRSLSPTKEQIEEQIEEQIGKNRGRVK
jgi:acetyltransferase-like isoleucine patch superfamily enzyme